MFIGEQKTKKIIGALLFAALIAFSFGHNFLSSPTVALAETQTHRDEMSHAPDSDDHSPCPTELHQTVNVRQADNDQLSQLQLDACGPVAVFDEDQITGSSAAVFLYDKNHIPPDLPLDQKTNLLL